MQKLVLKVELYDDKTKTKAMKTVSGFSGVDSVSVDMKDQKMILTGDIDTVGVVKRLRKLCHSDIVSVGPAKEEQKEEKKEEKKKEEEKPIDPKEEMVAMAKAYEAYYDQMRQPAYPYYYHRYVEEDPSACVIC